MLSQTAEYALRAMAWLALQDGKAINARDLSAATEVPQSYLSKIMRRLVLRDLVVSRKGHGGGFTLNKPRRAIRYLDILEAVDEAPKLGRCSFGWGSCDIDNPCPLHNSWSSFLDQFYDWATEHTLADIEDVDDVRTSRPRRS